MIAALLRAACMAVAVASLAPAAAQDRAATLADIRQELTVLAVEMQRLRRELVTTGSAMGGGQGQGGGALQRLDGLEAELRRLTAAAEELENRIGRIVAEADNRLADLEFRLAELEGGDPGRASQRPSLGGGGAPPVPPGVALPDGTGAPGGPGGPDLAVGEQSDFDAAMELARSGTPAEALVSLDTFVEAYPRSPLAAEAQLARARTLRDLGNLPEAGRAFLESYTLAETTDPGLAAEALLGLGRTLASLGETREACLALGQIGERFGGTQAAAEAEAALGGLDCG